MRVGFFHLSDVPGDPLPAAGCLDVAGAESAGRSPWGLLRVYEDKQRPDPAVYAKKIAGRHASRPGWVYQLANETNLASERFHGTAQDYAAWVQEVRTFLPPGVQVGVGAFSPGDAIPGVRAYSDVEGWDALAPMFDRSDTLYAILHVYGATFEALRDSFLRQAERLPHHTRVVVGETNFGPGATVRIDRDAWARDALAPFLDFLDREGVRACLYFAAAWPDPEPWFKGGTPVDGLGTGIERTLRDWKEPADGAVDRPLPGDEPGPAGDPGEPEGPEGGVRPATDPAEQPGDDEPEGDDRRHPPTDAPAVKVYGIDISNHQGSIDWDRVAADGRRFAFIKASECPSYRDPWLGRNWSEAKRVGLVRGAYCFARPSAATPAQSVELFADTLRVAGGVEPGDMVVLDIEDERVKASTNLLPWVKEWLERAEATFGVRPLIYSAHWYMAPHGLEVADLGTYPLWVASYQDTPPPVPRGWDRFHVWQFTAHGSVPGVRGDCDEDVLTCSWEEFVALGKPTESRQEPDDESTIYGPLVAVGKALAQRGKPGDLALGIAIEHLCYSLKEKDAA